MHIAVVASPWVPVPPPAYGGTEAVLADLIAGLATAGHDITLFGHPESTVEAGVVSSLACADIGPIGDAASELAHVVDAYDLAQRMRVDVIHDHTLAGALVGGPGGSTPIVVTSHGPFGPTTVPIFRRAAERAAIVAISASQAATSGDVPIAAVVHHGLDVAAWPEGRGDGGYVLFLGRMHPVKGPHRAIDLARRAGMPIVLAAKMREPAERAFFEAEVAPRLGADATYVGESDAAAKRELLAGARALLNPISWPEPFGMVMLEALACGTPVVTARAGAAPEIVEHGRTGFLCVDDDDYLRGLAAVDRIDRSACRRSVADRFSVARMVHGYEEVYQQVRRSPSFV